MNNESSFHLTFFRYGNFIRPTTEKSVKKFLTAFNLTFNGAKKSQNCNHVKLMKKKLDGPWPTQYIKIISHKNIKISWSK